jgi:hypothetical protein
MISGQTFRLSRGKTGFDFSGSCWVPSAAEHRRDRAVIAAQAMERPMVMAAAVATGIRPDIATTAK